MQHFIRAQWEKRGVWAWLLAPLSLLVCLLAGLKRLAYSRGLLKQSRVQVPVIVVGNLTAGGSGKSPLVAYLAQHLSEHGYRPGIICRGYRGSAQNWPQTVTPESDPGLVGDEPVMLANMTGCPLVVGPDRVESAARLLKQTQCDVIISDDGFQHLRLARDIDILVFDSTSGRAMGNGWCIPSGPLREPPSAGEAAHMQVFHGTAQSPSSGKQYTMRLTPGRVYSLADRKPASLEALRRKPLHAIAGIGRPQRFFDSLRTLDLEIIEHSFDDHHPYTPEDIHFDDQFELITTEKDAIKLAGIQTVRTIWVLPVSANLDSRFSSDLLHKLGEVADRHD